MKNFEMPKMNVSVFSSENVVTTSGGSVTTKVSNQTLAERALAGVGNVTTVSASSTEWIDA